jgi:putative PIN family toxin of toxin-antitoxin system
VRAVLDANILIAALLSPTGASAEVVSRWLAGEFELVVSEQLLTELERALRYPKLRNRVSATDAEGFVTLLRHGAILATDPREAPRRSADPGDDYLIALAQSERAILVSGDQHVLALADQLPVQTARTFLESLGTTQHGKRNLPR